MPYPPNASTKSPVRALPLAWAGKGPTLPPTTPPHKELVACMLTGFSLMLSSYYQLCASLDWQNANLFTSHEKR